MTVDVYKPPWAMPKCRVIAVWDEKVKSGNCSGIRTMVKYINHKGNEVVMTKWVSWNE